MVKLKSLLNEMAVQLGKIYTDKDRPPFKTLPSINEGPSYEYRKQLKNIEKTSKLHSGAILDLYELLRKKGLDKEASVLLEAYKKNLVTFKKTYDKLVRRLM